jgi:glutamate carboxypeptidase
MKAAAVGGGSDSAYLTKAGIPTLCALGVKGEFNHTVREWAAKDSLVERAKLLTALLTEI